MFYHFSVLPDSDDLSSKSPTIKGANVCSHVLSRQFAYEAHVVTRASFRVVFVVCFIECGSTVSQFQAQRVQKQA